jgi:hypothetical protein
MGNAAVGRMVDDTFGLMGTDRSSRNSGEQFKTSYINLVADDRPVMLRYKKIPFYR